MKISPASLSYLESLFVREFRASQSLYELTRQERLALSQGETARLSALTRQKESLLDELSNLESAKFSMLENIGAVVNEEATPLRGLVDFLQAIEAENARRLLRLQEGVLMLMSQVRELSRGNQALATSALQHANNLQSSLLSAYQFPPIPARAGARLEERPGAAGDPSALPGGTGQMGLPAVFAALIDARNVLHADDTRAIAAAVSELQQALESVAQYLDEGSSDQSVPVKQTALREPHPPKPPAADKPGASLVEMIANLHRQENAYQASLDVNRRMLAAA